MFLLKSWKESLEVFLPKNIVLFGKLTAHTMLQTIKTWLSQWWWLFLVWTVFSAVTMIRGLFFEMWRLFPELQFVMPLLILLMLALAVRPSVTIKNRRYFFSYWRHMFVVIGLFYIVYFAVEKILTASHRASIIRFWSAHSMVLQYIILPILIAFLFLWIIAFLDTKFHIRTLWSSFIKALKLVIYNYPFVWVISAIAFSIAKILVSLVIFLIFLDLYDPHPSMGLIGFILLVTGLVFPILGVVLIIPVLWLLSTMMNMYTRQVHEHFDRYY